MVIIEFNYCMEVLWLQLSAYTVKNSVVTTKHFHIMNHKYCKSCHNFNVVLSVLNDYFTWFCHRSE